MNGAFGRFLAACAGQARRVQCGGRLARYPARSLSLGIGGDDPQRPHTEDEVYYIVRGRAQVRIGGRDRAVSPGSGLFVSAVVEHRSHSIEEDLEVLVVFAPPRGRQVQGDVDRLRESHRQRQGAGSVPSRSVPAASSKPTSTWPRAIEPVASAASAG